MVELENIRICLRCSKPYVHNTTTNILDICSCDKMPSGWRAERQLNRKEKKDLEFNRGKFKRKRL